MLKLVLAIGGWGVHNHYMSLRHGLLYNEGYFHVFNRSTEGITIFYDDEDIKRFILLMRALNSRKKIGTISKLIQRNKITETLFLLDQETPLVEVCAYSLLNNHFHFVLRQKSDNGISLFMNKICGAYSQYFNRKYSRFGTLLQGRFKHIPLETDSKVIRMISYVNRNHEIHCVDVGFGCSSGHMQISTIYKDDRTFK